MFSLCKADFLSSFLHCWAVHQSTPSLFDHILIQADSRGNEGRYLKQKYTKEQLQIDCCTLMSGGHGKWVGGLSWDRTSSLILFRRGAPCRGLFVFSLLSRFPILPQPINLPPFLQPFSVLSSSSKLCVGSVSSLLWQFSHISYPSLRLNPLILETLSGKNYFPLLVKKKQKTL